MGIGFCFAPNFNPLSQTLNEVRKKLGVRTTFNLLGPLLNPANASYLLLGVFDEALVPVMADVLLKTGTKRAMVVHSAGLDEISCVAPARLLEVNKGNINESVFDAIDFGFTPCTIADLRGGDKATNAAHLLNAFHGKRGPIADTLILNAAFALYLYGVQDTLSDAISHAKDNLYRGAVLTLLKHWIECSHA